jgi:hypothetical protein
MAAIKQGYGSQHWLRTAVNQAREVINREIRQHISLEADESIEWVSPLVPDYAEYQDQQFVEQIAPNAAFLLDLDILKCLSRTP